MSTRSEGPSSGGPSKPAVFHRDNSKRVQRSNSNLSATSATAAVAAASAGGIGVGESKFVKDKRKMVSSIIVPATTG